MIVGTKKIRLPKQPELIDRSILPIEFQFDLVKSDFDFPDSGRLDLSDLFELEVSIEGFSSDTFFTVESGEVLFASAEGVFSFTAESFFFTVEFGFFDDFVLFLPPTEDFLEPPHQPVPCLEVEQPVHNIADNISDMAISFLIMKNRRRR